MKRWVVMGVNPLGEDVATTGRVFLTRRGAVREKRRYDRLAGTRITVPYQGQQVPLVTYVVQEKVSAASP